MRHLLGLPFIPESREMAKPSSHEKRRALNMSEMSQHLPQKSQFLVYQAENGQMKIEVRLENETVLT